MLEITEKQWDLVQKRFNKKSERIGTLEKSIEDLTNTIDIKDSEISELNILNIELQKTIEILQAKVKKLEDDNNIAKSTMSAVLDKLDETARHVQSHRVTAYDLDIKI